MKKFINDPFDLVDEMLDGFLAVHCKKIRKSEEVTEKWYTKPMAPKDVKVFNPAFDVTESKFITSIITEYGIARPPFKFDSRENLPERSRGKQKSVIPTLQNKTKIWNKTMSPIFHAHE